MRYFMFRVVDSTAQPSYTLKSTVLVFRTLGSVRTYLESHGQAEDQQNANSSFLSGTSAITQWKINSPFRYTLGLMHFRYIEKQNKPCLYY
jgi:hypothetical protein